MTSIPTTNSGNKIHRNILGIVFHSPASHFLFFPSGVDKPSIAFMTFTTSNSICLAANYQLSFYLFPKLKILFHYQSFFLFFIGCVIIRYFFWGSWSPKFSMEPTLKEDRTFSFCRIQIQHRINNVKQKKLFTSCLLKHKSCSDQMIKLPCFFNHQLDLFVYPSI